MLGRLLLFYFFVRLVSGAGVFVYYHFTAQYSLPWALQIALAAIIVGLTIASIRAKAAEGLIFAPLLYFVYLHFETSGLNTFQPELREGILNLFFPATTTVSIDNILSILGFSIVLYWNIRVSKNKAAKAIGDQTISVIVRRPKKRKTE